MICNHPWSTFFFPRDTDEREVSVTIPRQTRSHVSTNHTHVSMVRDHLSMGGGGSITPPHLASLPSVTGRELWRHYTPRWCATGEATPPSLELAVGLLLFGP